MPIPQYVKPAYYNPTGNPLMGNPMNSMGGLESPVTPQQAMDVRAAYLAASPEEQAAFANQLTQNNQIGSPGANLDAYVGAGLGNPNKGPGGFFGALQPILAVTLPEMGMAFGPELMASLGMGGAGGTATATAEQISPLSQTIDSAGNLVGTASDAAGTGGGGAGASSNSLWSWLTGGGAASGAGTAASMIPNSGSGANPITGLSNSGAGINPSTGLPTGGNWGATAGTGGFSLTNPLTIASGIGAASNLIGNAFAAKGQTAAGNAANTRLQPYQQTGVNANTAINNLIGNGPNGSAGIQTTLNNMPGYQFQRNQALLGVNNEGSAEGLGSNTILKAGQTANNIAGTNYQNYFNNLMSLTGMGVNAATQQGNNTIGVGNAQGASYTGSANAVGNAGTIATLGPALINSLRGANSGSGNFLTAASG